MNDYLVSCVAACPIECDITEFPGIVSFSQLSSQATSILLGTQAEAISREFVDALELYYRLDYKNPFIDDLLSMSLVMQSSVGQVSSSLGNLGEISLGLYLFAINVPQNDMTILQNTVQNFVTVYNMTFRNTRWSASKYVTEAVRYLQDFQFMLASEPIVYRNFSNAQLAYSQLSSLLSTCVVNTGLAVKYLKEAIFLENQAGKPYVPNYFYKKELANTEENYQYFAGFCASAYANVSRSLTKIAPMLTLASQKISLWLQKNSANNGNTFQQTSSRPITESITTISNLNTQTKTFQTSTTSNNEYYLGFWTLMECGDCVEPINTTWNKLVATLTSDASYQVSQCLMQYELYLNNVSAQIVQPLASSTPEFIRSDSLKNSLLNMSQQAVILKEVIHSYMTGAISGKTLSTLGTAVLNIVSLNLMTVNDEITVLLRKWNNDVQIWSNNILAKYTSICNSLFELSRFLSSTNTQLSSGVSRLSMWLQPRILYYPEVKVVYNITDSSGAMKSIENAMQTYLKNTAKPTVTNVMSYISNDIVDQSSQFAEMVKTLSNYWSNQQSSVAGMLTDYNDHLVVDDVFIQ